MKENDEFYKIEALISKKDMDAKMESIIPKKRGISSMVFDAIKNNGIEVFEVVVHSAQTRLKPERIVLEIDDSRELTRTKNFGGLL